MPATLITLAYKQWIDAASTGDFEKNVFNDSYQEFLIQVQSFDPEKQYSTWEEIRTVFPKANVNVQYKTAFAIGLYVNQLNRVVPDVQDTLGNPCLLFNTHRFDIIASDLANPAAHRVALTYHTGTYTLHGSIGDHMILSEGESTDTFLLGLRPYLTVTSYKEIVA
jgi:hypothetical protein